MPTKKNTSSASRVKTVPTIEIPQTAEVMEVKEREPIQVHTEEETTATEEPVAEEQPQEAVPEIVEAEKVPDKVPQMEAEMIEAVQPVVSSTNAVRAIWQIQELSDEDKKAIIKARVKAIIQQSAVPYIPALVKYKEPETTAIPPMFALVDYDHRFVQEGWEFYKTNVENPYVKDYLTLIGEIFENPGKVFTRIVPMDLE